MTPPRDCILADHLRQASHSELRRALEANPVARRYLQDALVGFPAPSEVTDVVNQLADQTAPMFPLPDESGPAYASMFEAPKRRERRDPVSMLAVMILMTGLMQMATLIVLAVKL